MTAGTSGNSAIGNCAVMRNPFSTAVGNPRIPDGKATLSCAQRYSCSRSISTATGEIYILVYPGFHTPVAVAVGADPPVPPSTTQSIIPKQIWDFAVNQPSLNRTLKAQAEITGTATEFSLVSEPINPNRWRVVSQGIRVTLINNALDNDGWWEAVRVAYAGSPDDHLLLSDPSATPSGTAIAKDATCAIVPDIGTFENSMMRVDTDWSADPSYMAGKLRDISKFNFNLHRIGDPEFVQVPDINTMVKLADANVVNGSRIRRNANEMSYFQDRNMDCIMLRLKANASTEGVVNGKLQVHIHCIQHVEEMYDPKSMLHRFMSIPPRNLRLTEETMMAIKRNIKAGTLRAQTGGVSITA